jgi:hypothetical protein
VRVTPEVFALKAGKNGAPIVMDVGLIPVDYEVEAAEVDVYEEGQVVATLPVTFNSPGRAALPPGQNLNCEKRYESQAVINRGRAGRELVSAKKTWGPACVEFIGTPEVDDNGLLDVLKVYDARPRMSISVSAPGTLSGGISDDLAPVTDVWVNGRKVPVSVPKVFDPDPTRGLEPFSSGFSLPVEPLTGRILQDIYWLPWETPNEPLQVLYGIDGTLVAPTAVNALGNFGWDSARVMPNPDVNGNPQGNVTVTERESVPPSGESFERNDYRFRIEVKDSRLLVSTAPYPSRVQVRMYTGVEGDPRTVWLDRFQKGYRSRPMYLVPEHFKIPDSLTPDYKAYVANTRIPAKLGARVRVEYGAPDIIDEAIASGVVLVEDGTNKPMRFVPGEVLAPEVRIIGVTAPKSSPDTGNAEVRVVGTVKDPVGDLMSSPPQPTVTINGVPVTALSGGAGGVYGFDEIVNMSAFPETHLQVRAESPITGGHTVDDRIIQFWDETGLLDQPRLLAGLRTPTPRPVKRFRVKVIGPKLPVSSITGTVGGVLSYFPADALASVPLSFQEETPPLASGARVYVSTDAVLATKIPGHSLETPVTPPGLSASPVVPVEIGGLVRAQLNLGDIGPLSGLFDVSGAEIVTPREGSLVNLARQVDSQFGVAYTGVNVRWRGVESLRLIHQMLDRVNPTPEGGPLLREIPRVSATGPKESTVVSVWATLDGQQNLFRLLDTRDKESNSLLEAEAGMFAFVPEMVANESPFARTTTEWQDYVDPAGMRIGPGRFFLPTVLDGLDLLYPAGKSDSEISEHLRKNGLRPIGMKRNAGTLVTVVRMDGKDNLRQGLEPEIDGWDVRTGSRTTPQGDELIDGDDLYWKDIREEGLDGHYLQTFEEWDDRGREMDGAKARSIIIQNVRQKRGLPALVGGKSAEYQAMYDAAKWQMAKVTFDVISIAVPALWSELFVARGWTAGRILGLEGETLDLWLITRPQILARTEQALPVGSAAYRGLANNYRAAQQQVLAAFNDVQKSAGLGSLARNSEMLGSRAVDDVVALNSELNLAGAVKICCAGPQIGGGATGRFDRVYRIGNRYVIIEAKGGKQFVNPAAASAGRRVEDAATGLKTFEVQGTPKYVRETIGKMVNNTDTNLALVGDELEAAYAAGAVEYYYVTATWTSETGRLLRGAELAWGVTPKARIYKTQIY